MRLQLLTYTTHTYVFGRDYIDKTASIVKEFFVCFCKLKSRQKALDAAMITSKLGHKTKREQKAEILGAAHLNIFRATGREPAAAQSLGGCRYGHRL